MKRQFWNVAAVLLICTGLIITWVTADNPIFGYRELNWMAMGVLYGGGAWCSSRGRA